MQKRSPKVKTEPEGEDVERLHVRIARSGLCSRRAAEVLIQEGRVSVNDRLVEEMGLKVGPGDEIRVDGERIGVAKHYTVILNKPVGVVTTLSDPQGRPTILKYIPRYGVQLKPVGRLDMDTEGLLLVTNDGELANRLAHPRYGIEKEYQAHILGVPDERSLQKLRDGIFIEGRKTLPAVVTLVYADASKNRSVVDMVIHEGRNRQVRFMFDAIGHPVQALKRTRIGPFRVKGLRPGEARLLGQKEVADLRDLVGL